MESSKPLTSGTINIADDTICAVSTPPGVGGIAVIRISGPSALAITDKIWSGKKLSDAKSHTAHLGTIVRATDNSILDQAVATIFRGPSSFTGQDTVELSVHGSKYIQNELLNTLINAGCRLAEPGEFTRRAFASGRMDLAEAEAVADLIASSSRAAHRIAINQMRGNISDKLSSLREQMLEIASLLELELDFSEEDVEFASRKKLLDLARQIDEEIRRLHDSFSSGTAIKDGIPVAIIGKTNVGKSSLLNILLNDNRAIVSDIHGTTRDIIEDTATIGDYQFRFMDTAGLRKTADTIENLGIERSYQAALKSQIILYVIDAVSPQPINDIKETLSKANASKDHTIIIINKTDLNGQYDTTPFEELTTHPVIKISALKYEGIEQLRSELTATADTMSALDGETDILITNARHAEALANARRSIRLVIDGLNNDISGDFIAQDLRESLHHLSTITGAITTPDILASIFTRFCIGK